MKSLIFILTLIGCQIQAQNLVRSVISSCGDRAQLSGIVVDWTLGEVISGAYNRNINLQQGFHQRDDLLTALFEEKPNQQIQAYPNPTAHTLNILMSPEDHCSMLIYNLQGQLVYEQKIIEHRTQCELEFLTAGNYILIIKNSSGHLAYFKLQKIN